MKNMLSIASGFQYSVNIGYDLNNDEKIINYMPNSSAMKFISQVIASSDEKSTDRARVLVGAYGKGKSHMVLSTMALLMGRDRNLFQNLWQVDADGILRKQVDVFDHQGKKFLPVIISGSNTSLTQAFILSLQRTLNDNDMLDIMPETNYQAAVKCIERWHTEYPEVYKLLVKKIGCPVDDFVLALTTYDIQAYKQFEQIYPTLTAGSSFNPFLGFDVVELYEGVAKAVKSKGYSGLYVIYDEFSKYLESNIEEATVSDTKMLQDFAEKCNRSGSCQMHILLICHKEIANYINKLPKEKTDGWRGVSERFKHIHIQNEFGQTYEIISRVIQKDKALWEKFCKKYEKMFRSLFSTYSESRLFADAGIENLEQIIRECYPLHPVTLFLLPRLSEKIAQNERTLFTFLSANEEFSLLNYIASNAEGNLLMPDLIYDYFQPLMQKELYEGEIHQQYILTSNILQNLQADSLQSKLVKTLALISMVGEFEKLSPKSNTLFDIYHLAYSKEEIKKAIAELLSANYIAKLHRNNGFLRLKESSGVDIWKQIQDRMAALEHIQEKQDVLNEMNFDSFLYPVRYNDAKEMTRYFKFVFISSSKVAKDTDWHAMIQGEAADGVIFGVLPENQENINRIEEILAHVDCNRVLFAVPKKSKNITALVLELAAVNGLREEAGNDIVLRNEYEIIYDDVYGLVNEYMRGYTSPEGGSVEYYYQGQQLNFIRKSQLSEFLSTIMYDIFSATPVINNEAVNKNEVTNIVVNNRNKVVAALLRRDLEENLGLKGSGQDVAIMRSTLLRTGVLAQGENISPTLNLHTEKNPALAEVLQGMKKILWDDIENKKISFELIYDFLQKPDFHIGMRRGLIPIYLAVVLHIYRKGLVISDSNGELPLNGDVLQQIDSAPDSFFVERLHWDAEKEDYIARLKELFIDYRATEENTSSLNSIMLAMQNWYRSLPRYSRELNLSLNDNDTRGASKRFMNVLRNQNNPRDILFKHFPQIFCTNEYTHLYNAISDNKHRRDKALADLYKTLDVKLRNIFSGDSRASLVSLLKNWQENLDSSVWEQVFADNTGEFLQQLKLYESDDERGLIQKLAFLFTGLRLNDWSEKEIPVFLQGISQCKLEAEKCTTSNNTTPVKEIGETADYAINFVNVQGENVVKRFARKEYPASGKRLRNALMARLEESGQSLSKADKRQVLMDILETML